ncbi:MAG: ABC transporter permease subunit [Gammaproteobacteria bacterium]|nr:ABC transporter permease subunit [Gammaproteobacteria bacterium]
MIKVKLYENPFYLWLTSFNHSPNNSRSLWQDSYRRLLKNKLAISSLIVLTIIIFLAIFAPYLTTYPIEDTDWSAMLQPPSWIDGHYFGTDLLGRDIFSRTLSGGRMSLLVGTVSTLVSLIIGVSYGAISGFLGGKVDSIMMRIVDILYALPFMFFVILLTVFFGRHIVLIFIAIGATNWLDLARMVRGQTLSLKNKEFIEAARASGISTWKIIKQHIIPNLLGIVVIYVTLTIPATILAESILSFLGLGVQEPETSWGVLVSEGAQNIAGAWWTLVFPAIFLSCTLMCLNFIGDGLRDALDPKDR